MKIFTTEFQHKIVNLYLTGLDSTQISKQLNISPTGVFNTLRKHGIKSRPRGGRIDHFNQHIFDVVDTEHKAYWLGFILGDGSVRIRGELRIHLANKDIDHLYKVKSFFNSTLNIKPRRDNQSVFNVFSTHLVKQLAKYSVVPNKTYKIITTPNIDSNLISHFYRGFFDADGCVNESKSNRAKYKSDYFFSFCSACKPFLEEIQNWIISQVGEHYGSINKDSKGANCYTLAFGGNGIFPKIGNLLYKDATIYLERKYNKYQQLMERFK